MRNHRANEQLRTPKERKSEGEPNGFLRLVRRRLRSLGERYIKEICSSVMTGFAGF